MIRHWTRLLRTERTRPSAPPDDALAGSSTGSALTMTGTVLVVVLRHQVRRRAPGSRSLAMVVHLRDDARRSAGTTTRCAAELALGRGRSDALLPVPGARDRAGLARCTSRRCARWPTPGPPGRRSWRRVTVDVDPDETAGAAGRVGAPRHPGAAEGRWTRPYREITRPIVDYVSVDPAGQPARRGRWSTSPSTSSATGGSSCCTTRARCGSRAGCCSRPGVMVASVPWQLRSSEARQDRQDRHGPRLAGRAAERRHVAARGSPDRAAPPGRLTPATSATVGRLSSVEVGPVAHGGHCVARHEGRVVFVRHALPGERVVARVTEGDERRPVPARPTPSRCSRRRPDRVDAAVPGRRPGRCGGCDWQHVDRRPSARLKAAVVAEQLRRLAGLDVRRRGRSRCPATRDGLGWRTRVQLRGRRRRPAGPAPAPLARRRADRTTARSPTRASGGRAGPAPRWPGATAVEVVGAGRRRRAARARRAGGHGAAPPSAGCRRSARVGRRRDAASSACAAAPGCASRSGRRRARVAGHRRRLLAGAPRRRRRRCVDAVLDAPRPAAGGAGARPVLRASGCSPAALADRVGPDGAVLAVEADAARRSRTRGATCTTCRRSRLVRGPGRRRSLRRGRRWHGPARPGRPRPAPHRRRPRRRRAGRWPLRPRAVAYVACDPAALARDVAIVRRAGYRLPALRAFDLFPMTHHVECVAMLDSEPGRRRYLDIEP